MSGEALMAFENGIHVQLNSNHSVPKKCKTFFNDKMKLTREFCLAALHVYSTEQGSTNNHIQCLDAFGATGITGLQWKQHLKNAVSVTINDMDVDVCRDIRATIAQNDMRAITSEPRQTSNDIGKEQNVSDLGNEDRAVKDRIIEDLAKDNICTEKINGVNGVEDYECLNVEVTCEDARVLMHQRQYHFIQLDPFGCTVPFLDAAFHNAYNGGVVVVTATDVASLYGKCSRTLLRNYGARYGDATVDYYKELAARVLLAAVARAAVRCKKGIRVLYCLTAEHFVQVCVRVCRGATLADQCVEQIHKVLHCRACQETAVIPTGFIDDFYSLLPCQCHRNNGNRSANVLGPIWCGDIFDNVFIRGMSQSAKLLSLSSRSQKLLSVMLQEAEYEKLTSANSNLLNRRSDEVDEILTRIDEKFKTTLDVDRDSANILIMDLAKQSSRKIVNQTAAGDVEQLNDCNLTLALSSENVCSSPYSSDRTVPASDNSLSVDDDVISKLACDISVKKDQRDVILCQDVTTMDKFKRSSGCSKKIERMFYVCLYRRHVAFVDFPRLPVLIRLLEEEGYYASATHFDSQAIRTNASQDVIIELVKIRRS